MTCGWWTLSPGALLCASLVVCLINCSVLSISHCDTDNELFNKLNNASLQVEQVDAILEAVENKDQVQLCGYTIDEILGVKEHSIERCLANELDRHSEAYFEFGYLVEPHNLGLKQYYERKRLELAEYCRNHIKQVVQAAVATISAADRIIFDELASTIPGSVENILHWDPEEIDDEDYRDTCKRISDAFGFADPTRNLNLEMPVKVERPIDLIENWAIAKRACDWYGAKSAHLDEW